MNKILIILLGCWVGLVITASAQRIYEEDVIYLKNGSMIRGSIIEQVVGEYVKIEVIGGTVYSYQTNEIEQINREPAKFKQVKLKLLKEFRPIVFREKGLYNFTSFGIGFSEGRWGLETVGSLQHRIGYRFNRFLGVGLGSGFDIYRGGVIIPYFLDLNGDVLRRRITPHYMVNVGYGHGGARSWGYLVLDGGLMGHAALGIKIHTRSKSEWVFTLGYKFQHTYQEFEDWSQVWNNWDFLNNNFNVREAPIVRGTRLYQKITWQISYGF